MLRGPRSASAREVRAAQPPPPIHPRSGVRATGGPADAVEGERAAAAEEEEEQVVEDGAAPRGPRVDVVEKVRGHRPCAHQMTMK